MKTICMILFLMFFLMDCSPIVAVAEPAILQPGIEKKKPITLQYEWKRYGPGTPLSSGLRSGF